MGVRSSKLRINVKKPPDQTHQVISEPTPSHTATRRLQLDITPRLPPEIIDLVIDFLYNDLRTLRSFSLVSSRFLPSCRYHTHRYRVVGAWDSGLWGFANFIHLLKGTPEVGPFIRMLFVVGGMPEFRAHGQMTARLFGEMLELLPNLTWLGVSGVQFREYFDDLSSFRDVSRSPPNSMIQRTRLPHPFLNELSLTNTEWEISELMNFLSLFSHIGTLDTEGVIALYEPDPEGGGGDGDGRGGTGPIMEGEDDNREVPEDICLSRIDSLASLVSHLTVDRYAASPMDQPLISRAMQHITNSEATLALPSARSLSAGGSW